MHFIRGLRRLQSFGLWGLLILAGVILFYRLGAVSLKPWDEAWYATMAGNLAKSGDLFELTFNGSRYWDHPPLGIYAQALGILTLGRNELAARLPMALMGWLTIYVVYLTSKTMGNRKTGLIAGLVLLSCRWFLIRMRSANLEAPLLLFQALTFYFAFTATKRREAFYLWLSFGAALMAKSVISVTLLPLVLLGTWRVYQKEGLPWLWLLLALGVTVAPWYGYNYARYGDGFLKQNIFSIGLRRGSTAGLSAEVLARTWLYLRSAIHKWYWPMVGSLATSVFWLGRREVRWTVAYLLLSAFPYFLSSQVHIWHLLPILPPMAILVAISVENWLSFLHLKRLTGVALVGVLVIALWSVRSYIRQGLWETGVSTEARIGQAAARINLPTYTQDGTYLPTLIYYANKPIRNLSLDPTEVAGQPRPLLIVTKDYLLPEKIKYTIVEKFGDTFLAIYE